MLDVVGELPKTAVAALAQLLRRASEDLGEDLGEDWESRLRIFHRSIVASLFLLSGCASLPQACLPPAQTMLSAEMFFGRGVVSEAEFAAFIASEITPRFPDGLTVIDARGQWRNERRGAIIHESSKLVKIIFAEEAQKRADLDAIADSYKKRFHQQSVLIAVQPSCVTF